MFRALVALSYARLSCLFSFLRCPFSSYTHGVQMLNGTTPRKDGTIGGGPEEVSFEIGGMNLALNFSFFPFISRVVTASLNFDSLVSRSFIGGCNRYSITSVDLLPRDGWCA